MHRYISTISILVLSVIIPFALYGCGNNKDSINIYSVVADPTISPSSGTYTTAQSVSLATGTTGADIFYTTNGTDPDQNSTKYIRPVTVSTSESIRAKAFLAPRIPSGISSASYIITGTVYTPTFEPGAGTYTATQEVTISCTMEGITKITYTTNGSEPLNSSTTYTGPLTISSRTTLRARAFRTDWADSAVYSGTYIITFEAP